MKDDGREAKRLARCPLICRICGDVARGMNYNVKSCVSCKAFFRRNALRSSNDLHCKLKYHCEITVDTRIKCPACRLKKCFDFGMKKELIQCISKAHSDRKNTQQSTVRKTQEMHLPVLQPLSLLRKDHSTLTSKQWNLLSNVINIYDKQNIISDIHFILKEDSFLPVKLRAKPTTALNYINKCISSVQMILKQSPYFHYLTFHSRQSLIYNNIYLTSCLNAVFVSREVDLWNNTDFGLSYNTLLGADYFTQFASVPKRLDNNSVLQKMMLFIMAFSSNYSIVTFDNNENFHNKSNLIDLNHVQDIFVNLLWKYLIYQYGYMEAVHRYSSLIKSVLDVLHELEELSNSAIYLQMMNMLIKQTEQLLIFDE
ncbi:hypothetical protein I4U23_029373 [Adineta vaga]|nr:hypothetical protein I4U23_029373 [Adineta vaga]